MNRLLLFTLLSAWSMQSAHGTNSQPTQTTPEDDELKWARDRDIEVSLAQLKEEKDLADAAYNKMFGPRNTQTQE